MFRIGIGHAAVLLITLTKCLVTASVDHQETKMKDSTQLINGYLTVPWINGLNRLVHSSDSPDAKEVRIFIRAIVAGETWATQILDTLWKDRSQLKEKRVQYSETYSKCLEANDNDDSDVEDGPCRASAFHTVSEPKEFSTSVSDPSSPRKARNVQIADKVVGGSEDFDVVEISTIVFFFMIGVVILGCTICDLVVRNRPNDSSMNVKTLAKFSLYTNALALFDTKSTAGTMPAIHGLRCLSCWWVIFGHRFTVTSFVMNEKVMLLDFIKAKNTWSGLWLEMAPFTIETFCVIGGFFVATTWLKIKKSGLEVNVFTMYLYRYLKLTPCVAALLLFVLVFSDRLGSGPTWDGVITHAVDPCRENWWINLLYLQNIVAPDRMCLSHTWYSALDMQLFWLSPLVLYPLYRSPKFGLRVMGLLLVASVVLPTIVLAVDGRTMLGLRFDMDVPRLLNNFSHYYVTPYNRAFPYLLGILLGYDVATKKRHLTEANVAINWIVTVVLLVFCTWLNNCAYNSGYTGDWDMEIAAAVLLRPFWSIASAWVVYACTQGYGGLVTKFLSLRVFFPLSRLTYCIYLVHIVIQVITIPSYYQSSNSSLSFYVLNGGFGDFVRSIPVALVLSLFVESPSIVLAKILLGYRGSEPGASIPKGSTRKLNKEMLRDSPLHID